MSTKSVFPDLNVSIQSPGTQQRGPHSHPTQWEQRNSINFFFLVKFSYLRKMPVAGSCTRSRLSCSNSFSTTMERSNPVAEAIEYTGICAQAQILLVSEPPNFGSCISFFTELKLWVMHLIFLSYQVSKHSMTWVISPPNTRTLVVFPDIHH